jgi:alkanesulfonate monooxygenase SsuD/methylene tetrahydromethanopterin reductase-like flavin-dependent oxidoreductase (luciferase family)
MKFSTFNPMQWPRDACQEQVYANELSQLTAAESQGYDGAWLAEQHFSRSGIGPSIHLTAATLAARTSRIRIGTAVTILPGFHPLRLAEEIAMLDIMSGGRFDWGVGRGYPGHEFDSFGQQIESSPLVFREQLEIVLRAWTGKRFSYDGEFFQIPEIECLPTPVQDPHPPIWITALSPATLEWAAQNDYPMLTDPFSPTHRIEKNRTVYFEAGQAAGVDSRRHELPVLRQVYVGETMAKAREQAGPALLAYHRSLARVGSAAGAEGEIPEDCSFYRIFGEDEFNLDKDPAGFLDFLFENCTIVGDEAYCRAKIGELQERIGLTHLIGWQNFGDLPHEASMASQRRLIEKVAPSFA